MADLALVQRLSYEAGQQSETLLGLRTTSGAVSNIRFLEEIATLAERQAALASELALLIAEVKTASL